MYKRIFICRIILVNVLGLVHKFGQLAMLIIKMLVNKLVAVRKVILMRKFENEIIDEIENILGEKAVRQRTFQWLSNKHISIDDNYCFKLLDEIFNELEGDIEGLKAKRNTKLKVDAYFENLNLVVEIDEVQHFTCYRHLTLMKIKSSSINLFGFDVDEYLSWCIEKKEESLRKGQKGYRTPRIDFPSELGRANQRAYFDAMKDILITKNLKMPILRISEFEINQARNKREFLEIKVNDYLTMTRKNKSIV